MRHLLAAPGLRLCLLALLTLDLELALIRFASAEVLYLGYFSNYILISAFLGVGLGFLANRRQARLFCLALPTLFALVALVTMVRVDLSSWFRAGGQLYFGTTVYDATLSMWLTVPLIFSLSTFVFVCIAQETARLFERFSPLRAYSLDVAGSAAGVLLFTVQSALGSPPWVWFAGAAVLASALCWPIGGAPRWTTPAFGLCAAVLVAWAAPSHYTRWSPYQKIEVVPEGRGFLLTANGINHQTMHAPGTKEPFYDVPYQIKDRGGPRRYRRALVIGAGSGTDVAYALHYGVERIDAVEIDPEIVRAGRRFHPSKPYESDKVTVSVTDGRAFLRRAAGPYDLIVFALPDSLALLSGFSSVRLESFLFTAEAFADARRLLAPDGVLVLYNYYRREWLLAKLARMLQETFRHPPLVIRYTPEAHGLMAALAIGPRLGSPPETALPPITPATDDWPFLYMKRREIPSLYLAIMAFFVAAGLIGMRLSDREAMPGFRSHGPFFLLGAAFFSWNRRASSSSPCCSAPRGS